MSHDRTKQPLTPLPDPFDMILEMSEEEVYKHWNDKHVTDDELHNYLNHHRLASLQVRPPQIEAVELVREVDDGLESREAALAELGTLLAAEGSLIADHRQRFLRLKERYDEIAEDVHDRRRRRERINCVMGEGESTFRIFDLEEVA